MLNSLLWLGFLLFHYLLPPLFLRLFGSKSLYTLLCVGLLLANLQVQKVVELFGLQATLGNASYALCFLITDYLSEVKGRKAARQAVLLGFMTQILVLAVMLMVLAFRPAAADTAHAYLYSLFMPIPQMLGASLLAYLLSQWHDVAAYHFWRRLFPERRWLWLRNNASTIVSQALDTLIFVGLAFSFGPLRLEPPVLAQVMVTTYLFKVVAAVFDTPFLYLMTWRKKSCRPALA